MSNIQISKKIVSGIIIALVSARLILSFFFNKELTFRSDLPLILDASILFFTIILGIVKYKAGAKLSWSSPVQILAFVVVGLLIYIILTKQTHKKQVNALTNMIENSE